MPLIQQGHGGGVVVIDILPPLVSISGVCNVTVMGDFSLSSMLIPLKFSRLTVMSTCCNEPMYEPSVPMDFDWEDPGPLRCKAWLLLTC